jgi:DNA mismatch repair protein MutL
MIDKINLLPDAIANQIAAGEVIQRPASAVKELMENAIDAGAQNIQLIIKDAGKQLIQVIDDGSGMSVTDARMSFERHATSKIKSIDDLFSIRTMGFRGEALASIAAVAQVEMKTRMEDQEMGTFIINEGCAVLEQSPCQAPVGTSIAVKNLFFNVPARRNFLKSNQIELRHILDEFQRIALAHPNVFFTVHHNGNQLFHLTAGNLKQRIVQLFGNSYRDKLVDVHEETSVCNISGFIGTPDSAKKTRGEQFFFVNDRFIKSNYLHHAVMQNYLKLIQPDSYPLYVLFIDVDPARIDINVHPTKQEIKFDDERIVYSFLNSATRKALGQYSITPSLDFDQETSFSRMEVFKTHPNQDVSFLNKIDTSSHYFRPHDSPQANSNLQHWQTLYGEKQAPKTTAPFTNQPFKEDAEMPPSELFPNNDTPYLESGITQLLQRFILVPIKNGVLWLDQNAAHERILFEKYLAHLEKQTTNMQHKLFPVKIELSPMDAIILSDLLPEVNAIGFDIQPFGQHTFAIHGIPADFQNQVSEQVFIEKIISEFRENRASKMDNKSNVARVLASQGAIRSGQALSLNAMKLLVDELFACETPYISPSGKLTFVQYKLEEIASWFAKKG